MKEFKLLIRNQEEKKNSLSKEKHIEFLKACEQYILNLKNSGKLIGAQPIEREGVMLSKKNDGWIIDSFKEGKDIIVGCYHIIAENLDEAIEIAKQNPEFAFTETARVEIRPIKGSEKTTGFVYPKQS